MSLFQRLGAILRTALVPCLLGALAAAPAPAYDGYTPEDLFPLALGYTWTVNRAVNGGVEELDFNTHRQELVNGALTTVLQVKKSAVLMEEWFLSTTVGLAAHRVRFFGKDFQGVPANIEATFSPALKLTGTTITAGSQTISSGVVFATFSAGGPPAATSPYTASSTVVSVGDFAPTPGAFSIGSRIVTTLGLSSAVFGGTVTSDIFFGRMIGPIKMAFDGLLAGAPVDEKKWLTRTNVPAELTQVFSARSPTNRATQVGRTVTAFASIINAGTVPATWCGLFPLPDRDGSPFEFSYAEADANNAVFGQLNPILDIGAGEVKRVVFGFKPTLGFGFKIIRFADDCWETQPALRVVGLNSFGLLATDDLPADVLMIGATVGNTNIVDIPINVTFGASALGTGAFSLAAVNLGASGPITVSGAPLDPATPVTTTVCETVPATGQCQQAPTLEVTVQWAAQENRTFAFFVTALAGIPFDPANSRIEARAIDAQGNQVGGWNTAVRTVP